MGGRDIAVNILLGVVLVSVFFLPFLLFIVAAAFVVQGMDRGVHHLWPGVSPPGADTVLTALFSVSALVSGVRQLRKKLWPSAFLYFGILPTVVSIWFADVHSPLGLHGPLGIFVLFPLLFISPNSRRMRFEFFAGSAIICAVIALNAGLLGSGLLDRIVAVCVLLASGAWVLIGARLGWNEPQSPDPQVPLSPSRA